MEPTTVIGAGLAVLGSKEILTKMLGPTADYLGTELKNVVEKCNINLENVFSVAKKKLGDRLDADGQVSPRVLRHVMTEGRFCDDLLVADYYGGVLAASKSADERDDRAVSILTALQSLSSYELRLHYLFYHLVHRTYVEKEMRLGKDRERMGIYIPESVYLSAMSFPTGTDHVAIMSHSVEGLVRTGFVGAQYGYGSAEHLSGWLPAATEPGTILTPTVFGSEVFLWAQGISGATGHELAQPETLLDPPEISIIVGSQAVPRQSMWRLPANSPT